MKNKFIKEWLPYIIIVIVVVLVRTYIITPVIVRGASMENTLIEGEVLFLSKISYKLENIERFDVVVIRDKDGDLIIKRIIGLPGDNVKYENDLLYINDKQVEDEYAYTSTNDFTLDSICEINKDTCNGKIPSGMYLALGDNRIVSADSRVKGLFHEEKILGKAVFRIWPLNKIKVLK